MTGPAYGVDVERLRDTIDEPARVTAAIEAALEDADHIEQRVLAGS